MTRSQGLALTIALLAIAAGTGAGVWWRHATHEVPVSADAAATAVQPSPATTIAGQLAPAASSPKQESAPAALASREQAPAPPDAITPPAAPSRSAPPAAASPSTTTGSDEASEKPSFDIVRVEPRGDTVVAGKGAPNAKVMLMAGSRKVGEASTDANGQFVILPPPLPPGDYALTLHQERPGAAADESAQSVAVSVPRPGKGSVVVALAEPGKATRLLSAPPEASSSATPSTAPAPAVPTTGKVVIRSAELENGSGFFVSGSAMPGTPVHVYLNDAHIADVVAGRDGGWSVRVKKGLTGGHYVVRADGGSSGRAVASRAEVPFDVPEAMAEATPAAPPVRASAPRPESAPTPDPRTTSMPADTPAASHPAPGAGQAAQNLPATPPAAKPDAPAQASPSSAAAAGTASQSATSAPVAIARSGDSSADATIESLATARVIRGDNLWNISRFRLGDGKRYTQIYAANADQIRDPDLIYPGQVFVVPNH